jgi:hypothetical protein
MLNRKQLTDHYGCSTRTIDNLKRGYILPFVKIGRFVRFNVVECDQAMEKYKRRSPAQSRKRRSCAGRQPGHVDLRLMQSLSAAQNAGQNAEAGRAERL